MSLSDTLDRFLRAAVSGDASGATGCFAPEGVLVLPSSDGDLRFEGRAEVRGALDQLHAGFSDLAYSPSRRFVGADSVTEQGRVAGRHTWTFAGIDAHDADVDVPLRLMAEPDTDDTGDDPLIARMTVWVDRPALMQQLGVDIEAMAAATVAATALREDDDGEVKVFEAPTDAPPAEGGSRSRRPLVLALVVLLAVLAAGAFALTRGGSSQEDTTSPAATTAATVRPTVAASAVPTVATANPAAAPTVQAGQQVVLGADVLFRFDSAELTPAAKAAIAALAKRIRAGKVEGTIQVNGYTDDRGTAAYDRDLSRRRALAVAKALAPDLAGLPVRLQPQGFGDADPVASNSTKAGQAKNRRVTIVLPQR